MVQTDQLSRPVKMLLLLFRTTLVKYLDGKANDSVAASQAKNGERIKGDTILLMLLRLRQCCSHPALTKEVNTMIEIQIYALQMDMLLASSDENRFFYRYLSKNVAFTNLMVIVRYIILLVDHYT